MKKNNMKKNGKIFIFLAVILIILGITNIYLLIGVPFLIYIGIKKIKKSKSLETKMIERAFYLYEVEKYHDSLSIINQLEKMGKLDKECIILKARNEYNTGNYTGYIQQLNQIPQGKINVDLDLLLKKGYSLLHLQNYKEALEVYKKILAVNYESIYVISKCVECEYNLGNYDNVMKYFHKLKRDNDNISKEYNRIIELSELSKIKKGKDIKG